MEIKNWQYKDLVKFIKKHKTSENQIYEFKKDLFLCRPKELRKHFCAFANKNKKNEGGYIFFGIDNDHNIIGMLEDKDIGRKISDRVDIPNLNPNVKWDLINKIPLPKISPKKFVYIVRIKESIRRNKPHISDNVIYMRKYGKSAPISMLQDLKDYFFSNKFYFEDINILEKILIDISRKLFILDRLNYMYFLQLNSFMLDEKANLLNLDQNIEKIDKIIYKYQKILKTIDEIQNVEKNEESTHKSLSFNKNKKVQEIYHELYNLISDFIENFKEVFSE